jgi:hypothetical protein
MINSHNDALTALMARHAPCPAFNQLSRDR